MFALDNNIKNTENVCCSLIAAFAVMRRSLVLGTSGGTKKFRVNGQLNRSEKLRFVILAPEMEQNNVADLRVTTDSDKHHRLLARVQKVRGNALREYLPNITALTRDGRHVQSADSKSWHILLTDGLGAVKGCARYRSVGGDLAGIGAINSTLAKSQRFGSTLIRAVEDHVNRARAANLDYGEVGGWVLSPSLRCSTAAVNIALMTFALAERLGGGMGITTATVRHHSASILQRLGGHKLAGLPPYYEPKFGCVIQILGFDMNSLGRQFARKLDEARAHLDSTEVLGRPVQHHVSVPKIHFPLPVHPPSFRQFAFN
jgi:hypothetical protein